MTHLQREREKRRRSIYRYRRREGKIIKRHFTSFHFDWERQREKNEVFSVRLFQRKINNCVFYFIIILYSDFRERAYREVCSWLSLCMCGFRGQSERAPTASSLPGLSLFVFAAWLGLACLSLDFWLTFTGMVGISGHMLNGKPKKNIYYFGFSMLVAKQNVKIVFLYILYKC